MAHDVAGAGRTVRRPLFAACAALVIGWSLTLVAANFARAKTERERELTFGREAEVVQQTLTASINDLSSHFESALAFIGSTHPLATSVYDDYFQRELEFRAGVDPGVMFLEEVDRDDLDALEARERALGNHDFAVTSLDLSGTNRTAVVITRASSAIGSDPFPFLGYDVTFGRRLLLPEVFPESGYVLRVAQSAILLSNALDIDSTANLSGTDQIPDVSPFFVGEAVDGRGETIGWAVQFLDAARVSERLIVPDDLNVRLFVDGIDEPILEVLTESSVKLDGARLAEHVEIAIASQSWSMDIWANPDFGQRTGLLDQRRVWLNGFVISGTAALMVGAWTYHRRRLEGASFELEHARTLATTDHLTGLLNRQGLIDAARLQSADKPATLYFIDLDGFKTVNDERGHEAGDAVLAAVAQVLRATFRHEDLVSRLGGDEFVVFTVGERPGVNAQLIAGRVLERIGALDPEVSCSLGIAHRPPSDGADVKDMLRLADKAMYAAKREGGNRFAVA